MTPKQIKEVLEKHGKWLRGEEGGERANLREANLRGANLEGDNLKEANLQGADLEGANLREANLQGADLEGANLREANLRRAKLRGAYLRGAYLQGAKLRGAYLRGAYLKEANLEGADLEGANLEGANLRGANLWRANLREANLQGADLEGANLLCFGNMREIRTMQINTWEIGYTADTLQIGCQRHPIDKWRKWNTKAGRNWIERMESKALDWADRNLGLVLQIIDANPATPTGHEIEARNAGEDRG